MNTERVMVFYDGNYFKQGQVYFRYSEGRGWFSLPELHGLFEKYVAAKTKASTDVTKVVAAHYYDGRVTTNVADADQLEKRGIPKWLSSRPGYSHTICRSTRRRSQVLRLRKLHTNWPRRESMLNSPSTFWMPAFEPL